MKNIIIFFLVIILTVSAVHASQTVTAGISPDNAVLWKLDVFFEHVNAFITYDQAKKIEKRMHSAEERAAEMEKMLRWKKTAEAEKAKLAYEQELAAVSEYVVQLEYSKPQSEFEAEHVVDSVLQSSQEELASITAAMNAADLDDTQKQLVEQFSGLTLDDIHAKLKEKTDATILKLKANGLTDENIAALQADILNTVEDVKDVVLDVAQETTIDPQTGEQEETAEESQPAEQIAEESGPVEQTAVESSPEESEDLTTQESEELTTLITDTSSKSKVKVDGELTAAQLQAVNLLYSQLVAENTDAEVEITVTLMENGLWKVEKEVDGTLTVLQNQQLDNLLVSLSQEPSSVHVKVKYDPSEPEGAGVYVGGSGEVETTFVIG